MPPAKIPARLNFPKVLPEEDGQDTLDAAFSKSQRKRTMEALQNLGVALMDLSREQLVRLDLPDILRDALRDGQRISSNSASKRQRQYIGRLMRELADKDEMAIVAIQNFLDSLRGQNDQQIGYMHRLEQLRDELLADDSALVRLIDELPQGAQRVDVQALRQMIRNARAEKLANRPPKHFRGLFQALKDIFPAPNVVAQSLDISTSDD